MSFYFILNSQKAKYKENCRRFFLLLKEKTANKSPGFVFFQALKKREAKSAFLSPTLFILVSVVLIGICFLSLLLKADLYGKREKRSADEYLFVFADYI